MLDFFGNKKHSFLGVDFGTTYIKVVELGLNNGAPTLLNYGQVELAFTEGKTNFRFQSPEEKVRIHFQALLRQLKSHSSFACVALPAFSGLITLVELPSMNDTDIENAIRYEAPKYIPLSPEEVTLSWEVVSQEKSTEKKEVLLVAALNKDIDIYESYIQDASLSLELLELEIFSLVRAVVENEKESWLIIDIGSRATNMIAVENGRVLVNRNINMGGNEITNTLVDTLQVNWTRAEQLKQSENNYLTKRESAITFPPIEMIRYEAGRILESLKEKAEHRPISGIVLSGGVAKMAGLREYFEQAFQLPVTLADPWKRIQVQEPLRPALGRYGSSFSVAIGLALGGLESVHHKTVQS